MTPEPETPLKVLYLAGAARVGMTILDNVLGAIDGFMSTGELRFLWTRAIEQRKCGCGQLVHACPVWSKVLAASLGTPGLSSANLEAVVELQHRVARLHHTPRLLRRESANGTHDLETLARLYETAYQTLADVSGARLIIDSSGRASEGALLRLLPAVQPFYVHLVRDPRACVYSQRYAKVNPDANVPDELEAVPPVVSCAYWIANNLAADALRRHENRRSLRLRYEDFAARPLDSVQRILALIGEPTDALPFTDERVVELGVNHTVSGNPARFIHGRVAISLDDRWTTRLSATDRRLTTALTWPLMLRYGYSLSLQKPLREDRNPHCGGRE